MISAIIFPRRRWIDGATPTGCGTGPADLKTCLQSKATHPSGSIMALSKCWHLAAASALPSNTSKAVITFQEALGDKTRDDLLNFASHMKWKKKKKVFSFLHHKISAILYLTWANRTLKLAFVCAQEVAFCGCLFLFLANTGGLITEKLPEEKLSLFARK